MWWDIPSAGNDDICHPFCNGDCYWPFNWRYCKGNACRASVNGDVITPPTATVGAWDPRDTQVPAPAPPATTPAYKILRSHPPQCIPDKYPYNQWRTGNRRTYSGTLLSATFEPTDKIENVNTQAPNTAVPYVKAPPKPEKAIVGIIPGMHPPPFALVPHSEIIVNNTESNNPVRTESSEWWKWWLLLLAVLLLMTILLLALLCGPKTRVRQPIKQIEEEVPIVVEEKIEVEKPETIVEEKVYKPVSKNVVIERKPVTKVEEKIIVKEKVGFNPYRQKSVDFSL